MTKTTEEQKKPESKLESILGLAIGFGLIGTFEYNLYRALDKLGYFELHHLNEEGTRINPEFIDVANNVIFVTAIGGTASLLGGMFLGGYIGRKTSNYLEKRKQNKKTLWGE